MRTVKAERKGRKGYLDSLAHCAGDEMKALIAAVMRTLAQVGYPDFTAPRSKHTYGDRWKIGLLVLKERLNLSYRELCRLADGVLDRAIAASARPLCGTRTAVDSTGFTQSNASRHYV